MSSFYFKCNKHASMKCRFLTTAFRLKSEIEQTVTQLTCKQLVLKGFPGSAPPKHDSSLNTFCVTAGIRWSLATLRRRLTYNQLLKSHHLSQILFGAPGVRKT